MTPQEQARARFESLWVAGQEQLARVEIEPAQMRDGTTDPADFCISTIARLINQPNGREIINHLRAKLKALEAALEGQFMYPDESLHVSLIGATPRQASPVFSANHIDKIAAITRESLLPTDPPALVSFEGVGIMGNQVFIQGVPQNRVWEDHRIRVGNALQAADEAPITYPDSSPIHINIARITDADPDKLAKIAIELGENHFRQLGEVALSHVELVITDFVVSNRLRVLEDFQVQSRLK